MEFTAYKEIIVNDKDFLVYAVLENFDIKLIVYRDIVKGATSCHMHYQYCTFLA